LPFAPRAHFGAQRIEGLLLPAADTLEIQIAGLATERPSLISGSWSTGLSAATITMAARIAAPENVPERIEGLLLPAADTLEIP
jgi:hypothetical protein